MVTNSKRIMMVASENDALPGTKVGGIGDVMRYLPPALQSQGMTVDTMIPSYGFLARLPEMTSAGKITIKFSGKLFDVDILQKRGSCDHYIFHHSMFYAHGESVYNNDGDDRPFAKDATKFAFFCTCVAQALLQGVIPRPDVIHCHDWHSAFLLILLQYGYEYSALRQIPTVFTIHNLSLQGIRPFTEDESSFNTWFPDLRYSIDKIKDLRYPDCVNPVRAAILLAGTVHTVSPSYAKEILRESNQVMGIYGGEGLENELRERSDQGALEGILNGCEYPGPMVATAPSKSTLIECMEKSLTKWAANEPHLSTAHWLAEKSIAHWRKSRSKGMVVTSVGRLTQQKVRLLEATTPSGHSVLHTLMEMMGVNDTCIVLGSGDPKIETFMNRVCAEYSNLIFLNGYSDAMSHMLYHFGDVFLMPSSFEPCGISQMLAMRSGQPCIVNAVGGLRDTVCHMKTGFTFEGDSIDEQVDALIRCFKNTMTLYKSDAEKWQEIQKAAMHRRFTWESAAQEYIARLYTS